MAVDDAVLASGERQAARAHGLDLAVAHASEVGADDIGCGLQHALFVEERFDVEPRPPRPLRRRVDADRRVHAADLQAEFCHSRGDQIGCAGRELEVHPRLGARVYTGMKMKKMRIDRGRHRTGAPDRAERRRYEPSSRSARRDPHVGAHRRRRRGGRAGALGAAGKKARRPRQAARRGALRGSRVRRARRKYPARRSKHSAATRPAAA